MSRSGCKSSLASISFCCKLGVTILLVLLWTTVMARGQDGSTGAIRGVVRDTAGALIPRANTVIIHVSTGPRPTAGSNNESGCAFDLLLPGDYSGRTEAPGMSPQTTPRLHLEVGGTLQVDFQLSVAGTRETVTVSGAPPEVETQPSSVSATIDERAINELPLNGRR